MDNCYFCHSKDKLSEAFCGHILCIPCKSDLEFKGKCLSCNSLKSLLNQKRKMPTKDFNAKKRSMLVNTQDISIFNRLEEQEKNKKSFHSGKKIYVIIHDNLFIYFESLEEARKYRQKFSDKSIITLEPGNMYDLDMLTES